MGDERRVFSIRVKDSTVRALQEEAARYQTAPRTLAEQMVEEGVRMRRHPGIVFVEHAGGRRDAALATRPRLSVWQIVGTVRASTSVAAAARYLSVEVPAVERALAYSKEHPDEIERQIAANDAETERVVRLYPSTTDLIREHKGGSGLSSRRRAVGPRRGPRRASRPAR
jgi:uncharacterized protein (DUF433 family)